MTRRRVHHGSRHHGNHPSARKPRQTVTGRLRVSGSGHATVETAEGTFPVSERGVREGMDGDEVTVTLAARHGRPGEKCAWVQSVLERHTLTYLGIYQRADPLGVVMPLDARIKRDFFVLPDDASVGRLGVGEGDVVVARILEYPTRRSAGVVTIARRVGASTELDLDVEAVVASFDLPTAFPPEAVEEARRIEADVAGALEADPMREDLRDECCITIDPKDARDFDDAVSVTRTADGGFEVGVHIADVTHYVRWGSAIDREARRRTCSTYLVDRVIPMLPEELSNDVCSLRPGEDRLCMSVRLMLDSAGNVTDSHVAKSAIRSKARLDYDTVDALLTGGADEGSLPCDSVWRERVAETLRILDEVASLRRHVRQARGAVDFDTRESRVALDDLGRPRGVVVRSRTAATSLVEEAMLMANEAIARMLAERDVSTAYRGHERPAPEDLKSCVTVLAELGLLHGREAESLVAGDPFTIQTVLARARGTDSEYLANALLLRAQKRAVYLPRNEGHYALGARAYCHFTSPIRRYPDDLVHRALKALLAGDPDSPEQLEVGRELPQLCRACSECERAADAASRASQRVKMAQYYADQVGERFAGVVVGVERFGLFVMLDDTCAEGLLPVRALGEGWHAYDGERMTLTSEDTGRVWHLGKRVAVEVAGANVPRGQIDFRLAGPKTDV